jgi:hypothetical protein
MRHADKRDPPFAAHILQFWRWLALEHPRVRQAWLISTELKMTNRKYWTETPSSGFEGDYPKLIRWMQNSD